MMRKTHKKINHKRITGKSQTNHRKITNESQENHKRITGKSQANYRKIINESYKSYNKEYIFYLSGLDKSSLILIFPFSLWLFK